MTLAASLVIALILVTLAITDFTREAPPNSETAQTSGTLQTSSASTNSSTTTQTQSISASTSGDTTSQTSTRTVGVQSGSGLVTDYGFGPCNCSVYVIPAGIFSTLQDLVGNTPDIWLANVTSVTFVPVKGVPFTLYNITNIETLSSGGASYKAPPGTVGQIAWVGGTANGTTMTASGYPTLTVGDTYIFFLTGLNNGNGNFELDPYWQYIGNGMASVTTGGAQGLFYVQDGKVFSLDNMYPQADAWLPVKINGMPLAQFISELQSG
jgi:hypothetical protein